VLSIFVGYFVYYILQERKLLQNFSNNSFARKSFYPLQKNLLITLHFFGQNYKIETREKIKMKIHISNKLDQQVKENEII